MSDESRIKLLDSNSTTDRVSQSLFNSGLLILELILESASCFKYSALAKRRIQGLVSFRVLVSIIIVSNIKIVDKRVYFKLLTKTIQNISQRFIESLLVSKMHGRKSRVRHRN